MPIPVPPLAFIAIIVAVVIYMVHTRRQSPPASCTTDNDCADGKSCNAAGQCGASKAPPGSGSSCYQWSSFNPKTSGVPSWLVGVGDNPLYANANKMLVPTGAQLADGSYVVGFTNVNSTDMDYGLTSYMTTDGQTPMQNLPVVYGLKTTAATCPTTFQSTTDPSNALKYNGLPVCRNFSSDSPLSMFTPYDTAKNKCTVWDLGGTNDFRLIQDVKVA